jgi:hypothetical protein
MNCPLFIVTVRLYASCPQSACVHSEFGICVLMQPPQFSTLLLNVWIMSFGQITSNRLCLSLRWNQTCHLLRKMIPPPAVCRIWCTCLFRCGLSLWWGVLKVDCNGGWRCEGTAWLVLGGARRAGSCRWSSLFRNGRTWRTTWPLKGGSRLLSSLLI